MRAISRFGSVLPGAYASAAALFSAIFAVVRDIRNFLVNVRNLWCFATIMDAISARAILIPQLSGFGGHFSANISAIFQQCLLTSAILPATFTIFTCNFSVIFQSFPRKFLGGQVNKRLNNCAAPRWKSDGILVLEEVAFYGPATTKTSSLAAIIQLLIYPKRLITCTSNLHRSTRHLKHYEI